MKLISGFITIAFALYLIGMAVIIFAKPTAAKRFLNLFASSAKSHYLEQLIRIVTGFALIIFSVSMEYSVLFEYFGWLIAGTTTFLLLIPWQWHHKFGRWAIPFAIRNLKLYGCATLTLGLFILYSFLFPYLR